MCPQLVKKFPTIYGTRRFITTFTCPYPGPDQSQSMHSSHFLKIQFYIIIPWTPSLPSGLLPLGLLVKPLHEPLMSPIHATCPAHPILLDLISQKIFGEE